MKSKEYIKIQESLRLDENKFNDMILEYAGIWRKLRHTRSPFATRAAGELASIVGSQNFHDLDMESAATRFFMKYPLEELVRCLDLARKYRKKFWGENDF